MKGHLTALKVRRENKNNSRPLLPSPGERENNKQVQLLAVNIEMTRFTFRLKNEMARVALLVTLRVTQQQHQYQPFEPLPETNTTGWFKWCSLIRLPSTALLARSRAQASLALVRVIRVKVQQAILDSKLASLGLYPEHLQSWLSGLGRRFIYVYSFFLWLYCSYWLFGQCT